MSQYLLSVWHDDDLRGRLQQRRRPAHWSPRSAPSTRSSRPPAPGCSPADCTRPTSATVVRSTDGEVSMTDGPYAESKEQMGGFWVIEAADLDAALDWARRARGRVRGPGRGAPVPG